MPSETSTLLLAYYGDDFTGSTDVMESLSRAGLKTVLFLKSPTKAQLATFPDLRAFGIAGGSRMLSPGQMRRELPRAFRALKTSGAAFIHYKICSTFDSSPTVGSIGQAIELGRRVFGQAVTPLVVGVPVLGRYVVFGNLFARSGLDSEPVRLDRHPTMSRHPITPMDEADIRLHLARQTKLPIELMDVLKLDQVCAATEIGGRERDFPVLSPDLATAMVKATAPIILFDTLHEAHLPVIGHLIAIQRRPGGQLFCAGSSGLEYALIAHWRQAGRIAHPAKTDQRPATTRNQIITVSGSCSPVTDRQIQRAVAGGYVEVACDTGLLADPKDMKSAAADALTRAQSALDAGQNVIFHTARGPLDPRRADFGRAAKRGPGRTRAEKFTNAGETLGKGLAFILEAALRTTGARRAIVCGGDSSTTVARALGIVALEFIAPVAPGGPLCRVHAPGRIAHGCEVVFKGGQVGRDSFFRELIDKNTNRK